MSAISSVPAAFDLGEAHKIVVLSTTEGEDKPLKYPEMFAVSDLMLINKADLLPHLDFDVSQCVAHALKINPDLQTLVVSAQDRRGVAGVLRLDRGARGAMGSRCGAGLGRGSTRCSRRKHERSVGTPARQGARRGAGRRLSTLRAGLARELDLGGFVRNDAEGVLLEIEGARAREFVATLRQSPPPLARIDAVEAQNVSPKAEKDFLIETSLAGETRTRVPADAAVCEACLDELFDRKAAFIAILSSIARIAGLATR